MVAARRRQSCREASGRLQEYQVGSSVPVDAVSDLILLILHANSRKHGRSSLAGTTRLQKLLFLLTQSPVYRGLLEEKAVPEVEFEPYKMGPFTPDLYRAVDLLANFNPPLVVARPAERAGPDQTELHRYLEDVDLERATATSARPATYALSDVGSRLAAQLWDASPSALHTAVTSIVNDYAALPLRELLRLVYSQYPEMTERSEIKVDLGMP